MDESDNGSTTFLVAHNKDLVTSMSLQVHANGSEDDSRQDDRVRYIADDDDCMEVSVERDRNSDSGGGSKIMMNFASPSSAPRQEEKVNLSPRLHRASLHEAVRSIDADQSFDYNAAAAIMSYEDSSVSEHLRCGDGDMSPPVREYFRVSNGPSIPLQPSSQSPSVASTASTPRQLSGARLQRCFAWSQDSIEQQQDQRAKRRREHQPDGLASSWFSNQISGPPLFGPPPQRIRQECSPDGPTYVHWEQQISDSHEIVSNVLRRALDLANDTGDLTRPSSNDGEAVVVANS